MRAATVVKQLCKSCRTCFMFYCMFYFTCDRSLSYNDWWEARETCRRTSTGGSRSLELTVRVHSITVLVQCRLYISLHQLRLANEPTTQSVFVDTVHIPRDADARDCSAKHRFPNVARGRYIHAGFVLTSVGRYCDHSSLLVGSFVSLVGISRKTRKPDFHEICHFRNSASVLCPLSLLIFQRSKVKAQSSRFKPPYLNSSNRNSSWFKISLLELGYFLTDIGLYTISNSCVKYEFRQNPRQLHEKGFHSLRAV